MTLTAELDALLEPAAAAQSGPTQVVRPQPAAPRGWESGVRWEPDGTMVVTAPPAETQPAGGVEEWRRRVEEMGLAVPDGFTVRLVEAKHDPAAWHRDKQGEDAVTRAVWRCRYVIEPAAPAWKSAGDLDALVRDAMRRRRKPRTAVDTAERALVVVYADAQAGKVGRDGGTPELVARIADRFDRLDDHIRDLKTVGRAPSAAYWMDAGDCVEGFENTAAQAFTNDLTLTEMIRVHRRLTFEGLDRLAGRFGRVVAATCGSNHARVRRGKDAVGPPVDDWGIEVMSQVADAYARNQDAYGHVSFVMPERWRDTVSLDVAGTVVGLAHGHQYPRPEKAGDWWRGQTFGRQPVADAQILISGHYHHFRAQQMGHGRLHIQAPTLDNGSDWYTVRSGEVSTAGLLVFSVGPDGWDDLRIL
ncbi:hypothetical protein EV284_6490 [Streptomyces sp. BK022]|uniref:hypothetical protein n=1 Tax=Streptomyces sp. BK022 TaxID=2512123 RepID=UPI0010D486E6|nr:hypothetical protein [Streptomyces sp. BK022]RZU28324.1 hypothetical protein EV284_6490 [Streptomyces sp. BK022]